MRLMITIEAKQLDLELPYHSSIQGAIYSRLSAPIFDQIHNLGFRSIHNPRKVFRFFSFSPLFSEKTRVTKVNETPILSLKGNIHFYVSSIIEDFILDLEKNIKERGINIGGQTYKANCELIKFPLGIAGINNWKEVLAVIKVYDLVLKKKEENKKRDINFFDSEFEESLINALKEKLETAIYYNLTKCDNFDFQILDKSLLRSYVIRIRKNQETYRTYTCSLLVKTNLELLRFVYATGLGSKNPSGLGFVDILAAVNASYFFNLINS